MGTDVRTEPPQLTLKKMQQKLAELQFGYSRMCVRQEEITFELTILADSMMASNKAVTEQEKQISDFKSKMVKEK